MTDQELLSGYVDVWWQAINDFTDLLEELSLDEWATPTDLPGWDVRAVASHVAHLEAILAGSPEETADVGEPPHVTGLLGLYTDGLVERRGETITVGLDRLADAARRHQALGVDEFLDAVLSDLVGTELNDDVAVLAVHLRA